MRHLFYLLLLFGCTAKEPDLPHAGEVEVRPGKRYDLAMPKTAPLPAYPWSHTSPPPITKHYFRCQGCSKNPPYAYEDQNLKDCGGWHKHSLPTRDGKEFIYPILIRLLNHIQQKTGHKVILTSGHRCPAHNTYVDPSLANQCSKHLIGAEVSFYVEGMENEPEAIVPILQDYYKGTEYAAFKRFEGKTNVSTPPWSNKEIFIKLFKSDEGRNGDNQHPYPYLSIQVRYDQEKNETVTYTWAKANRGFYQK